MELSLADHIKTLDSLFYGAKLQDLKKIAFEYAERNNLKHPLNKEL